LERLASIATPTHSLKLHPKAVWNYEAVSRNRAAFRSRAK